MAMFQAVSVAGFLVNIIGIFSFSHAHSHGGQPCGQSSHGHAHGGHGHSHGGGQEKNEVAKNINMEGGCNRDDIAILLCIMLIPYNIMQYIV